MKPTNYLKLASCVLVLFAFFNAKAQCPPEVQNFPSDITLAVDDECTSDVSWTEPTYDVICNGFIGPYDGTDLSIWADSLYGGDGVIDRSFIPNSFIIQGSQNGEAGINTNTEVCVVIPFDGLISFDWQAFMSQGGIFENDEAAYVLDGAETILTTAIANNQQSGSVIDLVVLAGQQFCFRVRSNNQFSYNTLAPENFVFGGSQIEQISGITNGSNQERGVYPIEYQTTACDGTTSICSFTVTVEDQTAPIFLNCPSDTIIQLDTLACDAVYEYDAFEVEDNCDLTVDAILIEGLASGQAFPIGITTVTYEATDSSGNVGTCSFDITVNGFEAPNMNCAGFINLSIDENCYGEVTPGMILVGNAYGCLDSCEVTITDENNVEVPNAFDSSHVGNTYSAEVCCGGDCCWTTVLIEDKFSPQVQCTSDTLTCGELLIWPDPEVIDNCATTDPILLNETFENVACSDSLLELVITRTWTAIDASGNQGDTCVQTLSISKFDIGTIDPPANVSINIECGTNYPVDAAGNPDPEFYGSPSLNGVNLFPAQFIECSTIVAYEDMVVNAGPLTTIVRTWTATTWTCGQDTSRVFGQIFYINDTQGPIVECIDDINTTVDVTTCTATIVLPSINAYDLCNEVTEVDIDYEGGFINNNNGGIIELPVGISTITYIVKDIYGNSSTCSIEATVIDDVNPIAIADAFTSVNLTNDGTATLKAIALDDGSFDECTNVALFVKRMDDGASCDPVDDYLPVGNDNAQFNNAVHFCCADIGTPIMVQFRVCDDSNMDGEFDMLVDNCADIMVEVNVHDKIPPILVADLPNITVSCEYPIDPDNLDVFGSLVTQVEDRDSILLTADYVEFDGDPLDGLIIDNCGDLISDELAGMENIGMCGTGTLTRTLTYGDSNGLTAVIIQIITIINPSPFQESDITWPLDYAIANNCNINDLNPQNLPAGFDFPVFVEDNCDQVAMNFSDVVTDFSNGSNACVEIERTWTLADWCQNINGQFVTFTYTQTLTMFNTIAPVIDGDCTDRTINSFDPDCGPVYVELINSATDDCTDQELLGWTYIVDLGNDGAPEIYGQGNNASTIYPIGEHSIAWTTFDGCGNEDNCSYTFTVVNLKQPTPICINNLSADLTPVDYDDDGTLDDEVVTITPDFFDAGSYHVCGYDLQFSFSSDVNDTIAVFNCDDIGEQPIQLWVTDENGNADFCATSIIIQDNNDDDVCPETINLASVLGDIYSESNEMIGKVHVELKGSSLDEMTEEDGHYEFADMPTGGNYEVIPLKDIDPMNGITTLDLILIQKHVLGLEYLDSPYKLIAADVNHSDNITGSDIIQLRKMILGFYDEFPYNTSWRFIDSDHQWVDQSNPWATAFPETYSIYGLTSDMVINFNGVKIGDVNNSAIPNDLLSNSIETRSNESLTLQIPSLNAQVSEEIWVPVYAKTYNSQLQGFQFGLNFDPSVFHITDAKSGAINIENGLVWNDAQGTLRTNWYEQSGIVLKDNTILFELKLEMNQTSALAVPFTLDVQDFAAESYNTALEIGKVNIEQRNDVKEEQPVAMLEMTQNVPNPWTQETLIEVNSPISGAAQFRVMDVTGKQVYTQELDLVQGMNSIRLSNSNLQATGVLYYELQVADQTWLKKMVRLQ